MITDHENVQLTKYIIKVYKHKMSFRNYIHEYMGHKQKKMSSCMVVENEGFYVMVNDRFR